MNYEGGYHQTADQGYDWLFGCRSKSVSAWSAAYRLYTRSVCNTKAPLQMQYAACIAI